MGAGADDLESFECWYCRAHARLVASLLWVTGSVDSAGEAVDEACTRVFAKWDSVGRMESPTGYAYRVALNIWRRTQRRRELERRLLLRDRPPSVEMPGPAGEAWDLVGSLPARQRTAVALRYVADLTEAQIGEVMGIRRSSVSVLLSRAHQRLSVLIGVEQHTVET